MKKNKQGGFTLIELLVVISIIAFLSSIVFASLQDARKKAKVTAFKEEVRQFVLALELYKNDNGGNLPKGYVYNDSSWTGPGDEPIDSLENPRAALIAYIQKIPRPPFTGGFGYFGDQAVDGGGHTYSLSCGSSNYFIQVEGSENSDYFGSGWIDTDSLGLSDAPYTYSGNKCYPLK